MLTRYVLMTFGPEDFRYWQASWCMLALLAYAPEPCEIVIATDHPEHLSWFGSRVRILAMSPDEVSEWIGAHGYFFRALIKTVELGTLLEPAAQVVVYVDTDTVAGGSLAPMIEAVRGGQILMDCKEYNLFESARKGYKAARKLWHAVGDRNWSGVRVDRTTEMWNTGITAVGRSDAHLIKQALTACDEMLASGCTFRLTEQIAMSAVLTADGRAAEVNPADVEPLITHYWGNKGGWTEAITGHLASIYLRALSVDEAIQFVIENPINGPRIVERTRKWHRFLGVEPVRRCALARDANTRPLPGRAIRRVESLT
jgi:hypothetical protein